MMTVRQHRVALCFSANLAFWLSLIFAGLPAPFVDDMFYLGAGLELGRSGQLINPWLLGHFPGTDHFIVYPPLFFYIVAAWTKILGVSTWALAALWAICSAIATTFFARFLERAFGISIWWPVSQALLFGALAYSGFRPEFVGFAFLFAGLYYVFYGQGRAVEAAGVFLLGLSVLAAPVLLGIVFAIAAVWLWHNRRDRRALVSMLFAGVAAGAVMLGMTALMIEGQVAEMVRAIGYHSQRWILLGETIHEGGGVRLGYFYFSSMIVLAALAAVKYAFRLPFEKLFLTLCFIVASYPFVKTIHVRPSIELLFRSFMVIGVIVEAIDVVMRVLAKRGLGTQLNGQLKRLAVAVFVCVTVLGHAYSVVRLQRLQLDGPLVAQTLQRIGEKKKEQEIKNILVDSLTARLVFDFTLPEGAKDWYFSESFPQYWPPTPSALRSDAIWVVHEQVLYRWTSDLIARGKVHWTNPQEINAAFRGRYYPTSSTVGLGNDNGESNMLDKTLRLTLRFPSIPPQLLPMNRAPICVVSNHEVATSDELNLLKAILAECSKSLS
ncbi:hypothetical protein [Bradyrhizobium sp. LHD-71]|uniref:ArnT family glycosyltransferase n=1 Tax=Bradyrhizobium sp. LHD-71 TaxID=3072141 RepID=UPI00280E5065|nr:hypothetical protein [Bradyrhizobium sp. LHD-71]MDQ8728050.1 hypothetical protein [Bradyrhizobium sp. LHD-71]